MFLRRVIILYQLIFIMKFSAARFPANKVIKSSPFPGEKTRISLDSPRKGQESLHYQRIPSLEGDYQRFAILRDGMKRLFRFPALSDYLRNGLGCKLALFQDTSSAAMGLKGAKGGGRRLEWDIFSLSVFAQEEQERERRFERPHRNLQHSGRRPNLKPVLRGSARYFIGRD